MIHYADPRAQYLPYRDQINEAIQKVLDSGNYILGEEVKAFEAEFAQYLGAKFAVGCGSGTDALVLALKALDIGAGDEVIVPSHTAVATVAAIAMTGATPIYVDIESRYYTMDPKQVDAACSTKTRAIVAVHLYGQATAIDDLIHLAEARGIHVIEDCAQAAGAEWLGQKLGTIGDIGCFSFFPTKNLGAIGDGGAIVCKDESTSLRLRGLRQYGWDDTRISREPGINSRLDELQAAILRVKLRNLTADNSQRRLLAQRYNEAFVGHPIQTPAERNGAFHVYHLYVIETDRRSELMAHLRNAEIYAGIHYPVPVHRMDAYGRDDSMLPATERVVERVLTLPLFPGMSQIDQARVIATIDAFF